MNVEEMIAVLSNYDGKMRVGLLDLSTDNHVDMNYSLSEDDFDVLDLVADEDSLEVIGQGLFITFENKLNEDPIR